MKEKGISETVDIFNKNHTKKNSRKEFFQWLTDNKNELTHLYSTTTYNYTQAKIINAISQLQTYGFDTNNIEPKYNFYCSFDQANLLDMECKPIGVINNKYFTNSVLCGTREDIAISNTNAILIFGKVGSSDNIKVSHTHEWDIESLKEFLEIKVDKIDNNN